MIKDIPGWEGRYTIDENGTIYTNFRHTNNGHILTPRLNEKGYLKVILCFNGRRKTYRVHRLVALTFIPNPNNLPEVNHIDGNKLNNHVSNLEWTTREANMQHAVTTGLKPDYIHNEAFVKEVLRLYGLGWTQKAICAHLKVTEKLVRKIVRGG